VDGGGVVDDGSDGGGDDMEAGSLGGGDEVLSAGADSALGDDMSAFSSLVLAHAASPNAAKAASANAGMRSDLVIVITILPC